MMKGNNQNNIHFNHTLTIRNCLAHNSLVAAKSLAVEKMSDVSNILQAIND